MVEQIKTIETLLNKTSVIACNIKRFLNPTVIKGLTDARSLYFLDPKKEMLKKVIYFVTFLYSITFF